MVDPLEDIPPRPGSEAEAELIRKLRLAETRDLIRQLEKSMEEQESFALSVAIRSLRKMERKLEEED